MPTNPNDSQSMISPSSLDQSTIYISDPGPQGPLVNCMFTTAIGASVNWNDFESTLRVDNDAHFNGNIIWKGKNVGEMLEKIESRLAILTPDPKKLEKFAALKKAYDHYKLLEKLLNEE